MTKSVLFDLDGTLVDTAPDFYRVTNQVLKSVGLNDIDFSRLRQVASNGALAMLNAALEAHRSDLNASDLLQEFLARYTENPVVEGRVFEGVQTLLDELNQNQIPWGVVTNKPRHMSERVLQRLNLENRCRILICPEDISRTKPDPEGLLLAARHLNLKPHECLYLGDHRRDIEAGRAAGMPTLACGFGYLGADESHLDWQADFAVTSDLELLDLIRPLLAGTRTNGVTDV